MGIGDLALSAAFLFLIFDGHKWVAEKVVQLTQTNTP